MANKNNKKKENKENIKDNDKQVNNKKEVNVDLTTMSPQKKLFVLREAIDFLALGIPVNQKVIDTCYDDLTMYLQDYEFMQSLQDEEFKLNQQLEKKMKETDDLINDINMNLIEDGNTQNGISNTIDDYEAEVTLQELAEKIYGDSWDKLEDGLDKLNEKYGTYYRTYVYPQKDGKTVKLKVFDDHDIILKRVYEDKYDLDLNLEQDIKSNFTKPKIEFSKLKLSKNKKENIE